MYIQLFIYTFIPYKIRITDIITCIYRFLLSLMMLTITPNILSKLEHKHGVTKREVEQCFENRSGGLLIDSREQHRTTPPTQWFIALTNQNRLLKVVFILHDGEITIKTAYPPNDTEIAIYERQFGAI